MNFPSSHHRIKKELHSSQSTSSSLLFLQKPSPGCSYPPPEGIACPSSQPPSSFMRKLPSGLTIADIKDLYMQYGGVGGLKIVLCPTSTETASASAEGKSTTAVGQEFEFSLAWSQTITHIGDCFLQVSRSSSAFVDSILSHRITTATSSGKTTKAAMEKQTNFPSIFAVELNGMVNLQSIGNCFLTGNPKLDNVTLQCPQLRVFGMQFCSNCPSLKAVNFMPKILFQQPFLPEEEERSNTMSLTLSPSGGNECKTILLGKRNILANANSSDPGVIGINFLRNCPVLMDLQLAPLLQATVLTGFLFECPSLTRVVIQVGNSDRCSDPVIAAIPKHIQHVSVSANNFWFKPPPPWAHPNDPPQPMVADKKKEHTDDQANTGKIDKDLMMMKLAAVDASSEKLVSLEQTITELRHLTSTLQNAVAVEKNARIGAEKQFDLSRKALETELSSAKEECRKLSEKVKFSETEHESLRKQVTTLRENEKRHNDEIAKLERDVMVIKRQHQEEIAQMQNRHESERRELLNQMSETQRIASSPRPSSESCEGCVTLRGEISHTITAIRNEHNEEKQRLHDEYRCMISKLEEDLSSHEQSRCDAEENFLNEITDLQTLVNQLERKLEDVFQEMTGIKEEQKRRRFDDDRVVNESNLVATPDQSIIRFVKDIATTMTSDAATQSPARRRTAADGSSCEQTQAAIVHRTSTPSQWALTGYSYIDKCYSKQPGGRYYCNPDHKQEGDGDIDDVNTATPTKRPVVRSRSSSPSLRKSVSPTKNCAVNETEVNDEKTMFYKYCGVCSRLNY